MRRASTETAPVAVVSDVAPTLPQEYSADALLTDTKQIADCLLGPAKSVEKPDGGDVCFGENSIMLLAAPAPVPYAPPTVTSSVLMIGTGRVPTKVAQPVIVLIVVVVARFQAGRTGANEERKDKFVDGGHLPPLTCAEGHMPVSILAPLAPDPLPLIGAHRPYGARFTPHNEAPGRPHAAVRSNTIAGES